MDDALFSDPQGAGAPPAAYRVLARKYRPSSFADLIGQEPMVRTLENAFDLGRIHQAYLLTGVRGVGKTTTARILARAFNYELPAADGRPAVNQPTIHMDALGVHCQAIIDSRHVDVLEMDAASHTGIDDVREIIDNARYRPVMARTKVYIIDEVHMLSKAAFNGLLKTLEEPPEHVKFIFATTEIDKVPVTVRSRCQRFDLRRIDAGLLAEHLRKICDKESVEIEHDALAMIARAAEGSVRDSLSLLDQAIAYGSAHSANGAIKADDLRLMLGVADKSRVIDLFEAVMAGDVAKAIALLEDQYNGGADPAQALLEMAEFAHLATRLKLAPETAQSAALTPEEKRRGQDAAERLSVPALTRAWQILMKGVDELRGSQRPLQAADMVLVRLAYAADMPTPGDVLKQLGYGAPGAAAAPTAPASAPRGAPVATSIAAPVSRGPVAARPALAQPAPAAPGVAIASFEALVALAEEKREIRLKISLESDVRLVRFEQGRIEFELAPGGSRELASALMQRLQLWTNERWMVSIVAAGGAPTLKEKRDAQERERRSGLEADPVVASVLAHFPGAQIIAVRSRDDQASRAGVEEADEQYDDMSPPEED
ncbi:DNA polymerase III subunit gamma/tau [Methylocystis sp. MJC1]|jgi:DNA polymerase-3 subunit gamma/tau|uniref:DNA polymerase III subunit gamma/tau n=1 Tax=Methylocystis sp. MJC1 TaxID=2654282 RepID=UPI0013EB2B68|nr:DNA polymerase III subunit gamma/tau [Methylocystis sp. MJC1]KAF2991024.1 DNA polymerase III subunit tau [Methylocystis sp. MJC1]MBU6526056.1 DNA polymerase III subunit gamma/tau [Methylocystis sp. MJC1]UZX12519.1 DNA polymerase III subunit gamma/tau [Methylocystis sp. MJC1]